MMFGNAYAAERYYFEKGDAIYSDLGKHIPIIWFIGHAGLYREWKDINGETGKPNNPDDLDTYMKQHRVLESNAAPEEVWKILLGLSVEPGVHEITFRAFHEMGDFWDVRYEPSLSCFQRRKIVNIAKRQEELGAKYRFFWGYKNPGKTFRCDGLVEYCYEQARVDIVPDDAWFTLTPALQRSFLEKRESAEVKEVRITDPDPNEEMKTISGTYTPKAFASDWLKGSGITMVEFWAGYPDDTPDNWEGTGIRIGFDNKDRFIQGNYQVDWDTTALDEYGDPLFPDGEYIIYAKAFDQAGNTKVSEGVLIKVENVLFHWTVMYEANELPTAADPVWTLGGDESNCSVSNGILTVTRVPGFGLTYALPNILGSNANGNIIEIRAKYYSGTYRLYFYFHDGVKRVCFGIDSSKVSLHGTSATQLYYMNTRDAFHIYRITIKGNYGKVYVDGILRMSSYLQYSSSDSDIYFTLLDSQRPATTTCLLDYLRCYTGGF